MCDALRLPEELVVTWLEVSLCVAELSVEDANTDTETSYTIER